MKELLGKLILIVGPSGCGKGTVIKTLKGKFPGFVYPVSYTTRDPREGEVDGEVYNFVSEGEFKEMIDGGELLEYAIVHEDEYYGTSKKEIMEGLEGGAVVLREIDIQGFHSIRKIVPPENLVSIFIMVSDEEDLKRRILGRGEMSDEEIGQRMESAKKEIAQADTCDYRVENEWEKVHECVSNVGNIVFKEIKGLY